MAATLPVTGNTEHTRPENRAFYPALDGLRAVAIFAVFWVHYASLPRLSWWGWTGVDLFFVLSGFLITGILYDTRNDIHRARNFYIRRSLRIFPLYFAFWAGVLLLAAFHQIAWRSGYWAWVFYAGNFLAPHALRAGLDPEFYTSLLFKQRADGFAPSIIVSHFWSLCVEEHFYLLWPVVIWWLRDRRRIITACIVGIVLSLLCRVALEETLPPSYLNIEVVYRFTPCRVDELLMGSLLAMLARGPSGLREISSKLVYSLAAFSLLVIAVSAVHWNQWRLLDLNQFWLNTYGFTLVGVLATAAVYASLTQRLVSSILSWRPLRELGRVSYGFYVLHPLGMGLIDRRFFHIHTRPQILLANISLFFTTWLLAWLSFHLFESPFLDLKERWTVRGVISPPPVTLGSSS